MSLESVVWWFWFTLFFMILLNFFTSFFSLLAFIGPGSLAYFTGLVLFLLLGNRLLFGYAGLLITMDRFLKEGELDRGKLVKKINAPLEMVKDISSTALVAMLLKDLDYYRYVFYGIFSLLLIFALLSRLKFTELGNYIRGSFWGAATVTFFVWSLDVIVHYLVNRVLKLPKENT